MCAFFCSRNDEQNLLIYTWKFEELLRDIFNRWIFNFHIYMKDDFVVKPLYAYYYWLFFYRILGICLRAFYLFFVVVGKAHFPSKNVFREPKGLQKK